jgi:hypothetical protein
VAYGQLSQVAIGILSVGYRSFCSLARRNGHSKVAPLHVAEDLAPCSGAHTTAIPVLLHRLTPREVLQSLRVGLLDPHDRV